ncbi:MAG: helix-turn-helix domain-containing protein [Gammaproteobacteria bacterium]|nr:helix-turn-helix domain-containing protein [Gammaproteobacteria bacterium]
MNELGPSERRLAMVALLASSVKRIRLLESDDEGQSAVAETNLFPEKEIGEFWEKLSSAVSFPTSSLVNLSILSSEEFNDGVNTPISTIDLVEDESGNVSVSIGQKATLEGESLLTLRTQDSVQLPNFEPSDVQASSCLSAQDAAKLLGVAKSTVTRRINKNELIGFHAFTNALRIPEEQFIDGSVVAGVPEILAMFTEELAEGGTHTDHKGAWNFLSTVVSPGDVAQRPIDKMKAGMRKRNSSVVLVELRRIKESLDYGDHI